MTPLQELMEQAANPLTSTADPEQTWAGGQRLRRRQAVVLLTSAVASVAVVLAVTPFLIRSGVDPQSPAPSPTLPAASSSSPSVDGGDAVGPVDNRLVTGTFDPSTATSLPVHPELGSGTWAPIDVVPLTEDPPNHAGLALSRDRPDDYPEVSLLGDDGRWRSVDVPWDFSREFAYAWRLGAHALSSDGTRLALGLDSQIVVIDLATGRQTSYATPDLGPVWRFSRQVEWSADGTSLLFGRRGRAARLDLGTGGVTALPFKVADATWLGDGTAVVYDVVKTPSVHRRLRAFDANGEETFSRIWPSDDLGDLVDPDSSRQRWAAFRIPSYRSQQPGDRPGLLVLGATGDPDSLLVVRGLGYSGGNGEVLGWLDPETVLFSVNDDTAGTDRTVLAWDVGTDTVRRGPTYSFLLDSLSLAPDFLAPLEG